VDGPIKISRTIPARTESFEVLWISLEFIKMNPHFREIRSSFRYKADRCWWCSHEFVDDEMMALGCIKGKGNKSFCQTCAKKIRGAAL